MGCGVMISILSFTCKWRHGERGRTSRAREKEPWRGIRGWYFMRDRVGKEGWYRNERTIASRPWQDEGVWAGGQGRGGERVGIRRKRITKRGQRSSDRVQSKSRRGLFE